jgi:hypothetical protein
MKFRIDTKESEDFANKLQKMHRSAFPSAIRGTLNKTIFDVKTKTMPKSADDAFVKRQPNFFKANSRFENAIGFNINSMKAVVGFVENGLKGGNNYAVQDLEEQEHGGTIDKKSFIPLPGARKGGGMNGLVKPNSRLSGIKKLIDVRKIKTKNKRARFAAAMAIAGRGGHVLSERTVWRVDSLRKTGKGVVYKKTKLYNFKKGRKVQVETTWFMRNASLRSAEKMYSVFELEANRQLSKLKK